MQIVTIVTVIEVGFPVLVLLLRPSEISESSSLIALGERPQITPRALSSSEISDPGAQWIFDYFDNVLNRQSRNIWCIGSPGTGQYSQRA